MMKLYSGATCPHSHRCRFALSEKGIEFELVDVDPHHPSEAINPHFRNVPVLLERDVILYEANIINEYIDERYPVPQLMSADPAMRARVRLQLHRYERELYAHIQDIQHGSPKVADKARSLIRDNLTQFAQDLGKQKYLLNDEFSMLDVAMAPLLWRLDAYGIKLGKEAELLTKYTERVFARKGFVDSLTSAERAMKK